MKSKLKLMGALSLATVLGFSLASCASNEEQAPSKPEDGGVTEPKPDGGNNEQALPKYDDLLATVSGNYNITPTVQQAKYETNGFKVKKDGVNVILESKIDEVTKTRLTAILEKEQFTNVTFGDKFVDNKVNILVGINGSTEFVDKFMEKNDNEAEGFYEKTDAYQLYIKNGVIAILGKDVDSAFYGVNTLDEILDFASENENSLINASIDDFATSKNRGVVEGFYGQPWTTEGRVDVIEWGSQFKMNNYMFAPKDDLYHSEKWRDLYPTETLGEMKKIADASIKNKVDFTWAIHPFMKSGFNFNDYDKDLKVIKDKFEQLYSVGVRSFALSADDITHPEAEKSKPAYWEALANNHVKVVKDLIAWGNTKEEKISWQFVPTVYCGYNQEKDEPTMGKYLEVVGKTLPQEVYLHWTGEQVYGTLSKATVDMFINKTGRAPMFWLNSPVNDSWGLGQKMFMPEMTVLHKDVENIDGLLLNPMSHDQASKVAIFQGLDYAWNIKGFDSAKSHEKSFYTIEKDQEMAKQLYIFASNLQSCENPVNGWIPRLNHKESPLFTGLLEPVLETAKDKTLINSGDKTINVSKLVREQLVAIVNAIDAYTKGATNKDLLVELDAHMKALKDMANGGIKMIDVLDGLAKGELNKEKAGTSLAAAIKEVNNSQSRYMVQGVPHSGYAETGILILRPFFTSLNEKLNAIINQM